MLDENGEALYWDMGAFTCHVFILTPVMVLRITVLRTVTFETQALVLSFPSPPMLMPCPGPQFMSWIYMFEHPVCMEIQSSPGKSFNGI